MGLSGTDLKLGQKLQKQKKKQRNKTQKNLNFEFLS